jgi:very-short-patch-repair endonuclease
MATLGKNALPGPRKSLSPFRRKHNLNAARTMRHEPTPAENALWQQLRNRPLISLV